VPRLAQGGRWIDCAMTSSRTALRHNAFLYQSHDDYLARAVPFLTEGLEAGEGAIVAHTRPGLAMIREALGSDATHVNFVDVSSAYTRPARTVAAYHKVYAEQLGKAPKLRAVADVQFGPDPREWAQWTGYEAVFNRSFGHLPAWVLCSYNANGTPDPIIEGVWQTHPEVIDGNTWTTSALYEDPDAVLRRMTPPPEELPGLRSIPFGGDPEQLRERLAPELIAAGIGEAKTLEMLLAATEIAANAIEHGSGIEHVRVGHALGRFVCEIADRGPGFDDPAAGYLAPRDGLGSGLWVARQLTRRIEFFRSSRGFTARIWL
jgi:anti-sigma regulatory factor (Ser/Thr protein kinase)